MAKAIWKYKIEARSQFFVEMPMGSRVLHVGLQGGEPYMWCEVDLEQKRFRRSFIVMPTGVDLPERCQYEGTWVTPLFVWHLYTVEGRLLDDDQSEPAT